LRKHHTTYCNDNSIQLRKQYTDTIC